MSQVTSGLRAILSHPFAYNSLQVLVGAARGRARVVRDFVRPTPGMRILDLGCGTAELLTVLPENVIYVGYDMSPAYITSARRKFGHRGTFHCRRLEETEADSIERFDLVMGIGVLHHLDDPAARQFMRTAMSALRGGGRIFTLDPCFVPGQNPVARLLISQDRGQNVRTPDGYRALVEGLGLAISGQVTNQSWLPYTHWNMECTTVSSSSRL